MKVKLEPGDIVVIPDGVWVLHGKRLGMVGELLPGGGVALKCGSSMLDVGTGPIGDYTVAEARLITKGVAS